MQKVGTKPHIRKEVKDQKVKAECFEEHLKGEDRSR